MQENLEADNPWDVVFFTARDSTSAGTIYIVHTVIFERG
jgi:hypothetical protein